MTPEFRLSDLHIHSEYSHDCATPLLTIKRFAQQHDLIVAITDHNEIRGNLHAQSLGIPVIPAIEVTTKNLKDVLVYFHDQDNLKDFYIKHILPARDPGVIWGSRTTLTMNALIDATNTYDCFTSLAHPYCPRPKRSAATSGRILRKLGGIEVMNFGMSPRANWKAAMLCDTLGKAHTAGSDSHHPTTLGAVTVRGHGETPSEFLTSVRNGQTVVVGMQRKTRDVVSHVMKYIAYRATH